MNYIRHLNAFFTRIKKDNRLNTSHVSLYLALFQYWNFNRFQNPFPVYRANIMQLSKIGSKNTYHKCLKELHGFGYIRYHRADSRYQPVQISIIRLDIPAQHTHCQQLDLFSHLSSLDFAKVGSPIPHSSALSQTLSSPGSPKTYSPLSSNLTLGASTKAEDSAKTDALAKSEQTIQSIPSTSSQQLPNPHCVPVSYPSSPNTGPQQVPKSVPIIKQENRIKPVSYAPTENIMKKGEEEKKSKPMQVPNVVHVPSLEEVEQYFYSHQYTLSEAHKFYYYNQAKNWKLSGTMPISNWQAIAQKWMINIRQDRIEGPRDLEKEIQNIYMRFVDGEKIASFLTEEHFHHLQLKLTPEIYHKALRRRMNQLLGSNQHTNLQLYQAYERNEPADPLIKSDYSNLTLLAMRLAILEIFRLRDKIAKKGDEIH